MHKNFISISYSSLDILFPNELIEASMYAGDDKTDFTTHSVEYKNERAVSIFIDKIITSLFFCSQGGHAYTALLFSKTLFSSDVAKKWGKFTKKSAVGYFAFLTSGETRVVQLSVSDFSPLRGITGQILKKKGLAAVRFTSQGRIQFLTDFNSLLASSAGYTK